VLVVHGIGSQRALETVRGVVDAVWLQDPGDPTSDKPPRQVWTHPEFSGVDIDLSVITTSRLATNTPNGPQDRSIDFHELYWAHLMSETRAIAVLLWLFELVKKGPRLKPGLNPLWWGISTFLCLLVISIVLLGLRAIQLFAGLFCYPIKSVCELHQFLDAPLLIVFSITVCVLFFSVILWACRWILLMIVAGPLCFALLYLSLNHDSVSSVLSYLLLPISTSLIMARLIMGRWGMAVTALVYLVSSALFMIYLHERWLLNINHSHPFLDFAQNLGGLLSGGWQPFAKITEQGWILWSLTESMSRVIACAVIAVYLVLNAIFLQSYLGDAARYFRASPGNVAVRREIRKQAVDTLDALHASGKYDRIIVVAHSLGTVIAYDMLRAYFSRICNDLPDPALLGPNIQTVDKMIVNPEDLGQKSVLRSAARDIVRKIADFPQDMPLPAGSLPRPAKWLVTDFVTLGSALTQAHYLMCDGHTYNELTQDFDRRVKEREFPTCPPARLDHDGLLLFKNPNTKKQEFHHGAVFGLTRWTNLYFPMRELVWGDAIGGKLASLFGSNIEDRRVPTLGYCKYAFFTHTDYWNVGWPGGRGNALIRKLIKAIDLKDRDNV
jgi:hypothetical protein